MITAGLDLMMMMMATVGFAQYIVTSTNSRGHGGAQVTTASSAFDYD